jgi:lipopolysaccharide transport system permease protein
MEAVRAPLEKTITAKPMLAKINFPREAIIISGIYQTGFNAIIKISLVIVALAIFGIQPGLSILFIPAGILSLILTGTMLGILLTPIGILYTDIGKSLPLLLQFLMYVTPVVFTIPEAGWPATIFKLNPLTPLIETVRDWLTGFTPESYIYFVIVSLTVVFLLFVVWVIYRVAMPIVIERMSA